MKSAFFFVLAVVILTGQTFSQQSTSPNFFEIQKRSLEYFKTHPVTPSKDKNKEHEDGSYSNYKRWEWFWKQRVTPDGKFPDPMVVYNETVKKREDLKKNGGIVLSPTAEAKWKALGPFGSAQNGGAGRVNRIHLNPAFPNDVWAGTAAGGAWKSTDKGQTWIVKTDAIPILGVTDIATVSTEPNTVYIATGDGDGILNGTNIQDFISYSLGVMKSTDGGNTWKTTGLNWQTSNARLIARLLVSPANPQLLLAATSQGMYKSLDGGTSWSFTQNGRFYDMEFKPDNPSIIYASTENVIYKSTNEGTTWTKLNTDIPTSIGRIAIGVSTYNSDMIYAVCASKSNWGFGGFYVSTNSGQTWQSKTTKTNILGYESNGNDDPTEGFQGWYDLAIAVSPSSSQEVYVGGINIWKTTNGGISWTCNAHWYGDNNLPYVHADIHDLAVSESNPTTVYSGRDGGVFQTNNDGKTWSDVSEGLGIMQFYRVASATSNTIQMGGAQDNGTNLLKNGIWTQVNDGDGMTCLIDPGNSNILYAASQEGDISRSTDGGVNFPSFINSDITNEPASWVAPYVFDPTDSKNIYAGFVNVWKYNPISSKWRKISNLVNGNTLNYIGVAPSDTNYVYAGNDGEISYTSNGGKSWQPITLPSQIGYVTHLEVHPKNPRRIWITVSGYSEKKVFESTDAGGGWVDISKGLPSIPVNCIVYQNNSADRLYIGTEAGVYFRDNEMTVWQPFNDGLPNVIVSDLKINYAAKKLLAGTYGRGLWEANLITCFASQVRLAVSGGKTLICDGDSVEVIATGGFSAYEWSNGATTQSIYVKKAGEYSVTVTDDRGCSSISPTIVFTVNIKKTPNIKGNHADSTACEGNPITLDIGFGFTGYSIKWSTGDTTRSIKVSKPGTYTAMAVSVGGCVGLSKPFVVKPGAAPEKPTISISKDTLIASPATAYQWYIDGVQLFEAVSRWLIPPSGTLGKKVSVATFNEEGCSTLSDDYLITVTSVEDEKTEQAIQLFPNPAEETITLEMTLETLSLISVEIVNSAGSTVQKNELAPDNLLFRQNVSLKELPVGAYIVTIRTNGKAWIRKITKK
ncbi:MAG: T9SS type A sorting domain-containing protein [Ignavibacteriae bacterium]|nr:T9SS type A sorting domain-containing protein [Ignavibacteriota bacterium]